ncbi:MAG: hypothetical protein JOY80_11650 [Candidatus Dormibacteraeota bacterium]|nr:hypothetical protein [Candidatus Dormibacteraeota bacterium]
MRVALAGAAETALGPDWRELGSQQLMERAGAPKAVAVPPPIRARPDHSASRVLRAVVGSLVVAVPIAAGLLIGLLVASLRGAPATTGTLTVPKPAALQFEPVQGSCGTTFMIVATGPVQGQGTLLYRWERSDGLQTQDTPLVIPAGDSSYRISEHWTLGVSTPTPWITFRIVSPAPVAVTQRLPYSCP